MVKRILVDRFPFDRDAAERKWGERGIWPAFWITLPGDQAQPRCTVFRNRFELGAPACLRFFIAADAVYRLMIDGEFAASGPEQGDAKHTFVDCFEWEASAGAHVFTVLVASFGESGPYSKMEFRHGLLVAAEGEFGEKINTCAAGWQAADPGMHRWQPPFGWACSIGDELIFDAAGFPRGMERGEECVEWRPVTEFAPGATASQRNEFSPQPLLEPARLPEMIHTAIKGYSLRFVGENVDNCFRAAANLPELLPIWEKGLQQGGLTVPAGRRVKALLELDDYYCAMPRLTVSGGRGAKISIGWVEALFLNNVEVGRKADRRDWRDRYFVGIYDHFLPDGRNGMQFHTLHYRAGCFVSVEIETGDEPVTIDEFRLVESRYPVAVESFFECEDESIEWLASRCRRTLEMCSHDTFMDCPYYEQLMYVGDTRIQALLTLALGRDSRLVEKALRMIAASRLESGLLQSRYPSRITQVIPTFTPYFVGMVADYARWRGGSLPRELFPVAHSGADAFENFLNRDGLIEIRRGWNFVDWTGWPAGVPPEGEFGVSGVVNALYLYLLGEIAELCRLLGEVDLERHYRARLGAMAERFIDAFWSDEIGLFRDTLSGTGVCEHTQILALLSGGLPEAVRARCIESFVSRDLPVRATVYFSFYLFELYGRIGRIDLLFERLKVFLKMRDLGLYTVLERPEPSRSDCHAWSAHPLYHLYATVLGVRPCGFGFREVEVRPQPGVLRHIRGRVVHPAGGFIEVEADDRRAHVVLPAGVPGRFIAPNGGVSPLAPGNNDIIF